MKPGAFLFWAFLVIPAVAIAQQNQNGQDGQNGQQQQGQQGQGGCGGQGQGGQQGQQQGQQAKAKGQQQGAQGDAAPAQGRGNGQNYPGQAPPTQQASSETATGGSESEIAEGGEPKRASRSPVIGGASMASLLSFGGGISEGGYLFDAIAAVSGLVPAASLSATPQVTMDGGDTVGAILSLSPSDRLVANASGPSSAVAGPNLLGNNPVASGSRSAPEPRAVTAGEAPARAMNGVGTPPPSLQPAASVVYGGHRPR